LRVEPLKTLNADPTATGGCAVIPNRAIHSFFFANDVVAAMREAGRVAKPGAPVVIQAWGAHERCDLEAMKQIARGERAANLGRLAWTPASLDRFGPLPLAKLPPFCVLLTDNAPRVPDGYVSVGTRGHAWARPAYTEGAICRKNVIAHARP
jgi:hypothetical protein